MNRQLLIFAVLLSLLGVAYGAARADADADADRFQACIDDWSAACRSVGRDDLTNTLECLHVNLPDCKLCGLDEHSAACQLHLEYAHFWQTEMSTIPRKKGKP